MSEKSEVFKILSEINVNDKVEKKNGLTYLSWAFAWAEVKKKYPDAEYKIFRHGSCNGLPYVYDPLTGYMVFTSVAIESVEHEMWLPVMDGANRAMKSEPYQYDAWVWKSGVKTATKKTCDAADMFDINKTIMRCLVKNLAMFGLGLYIYSGEDLPEVIEETTDTPKVPSAAAKAAATKAAKAAADETPKITSPNPIDNPNNSEAPAETPVYPVGKPYLIVGTPEWEKVKKFAVENKALGFDKVVSQIHRRYATPVATVKEISKLITGSHE